MRGCTHTEHRAGLQSCAVFLHLCFTVPPLTLHQGLQVDDETEVFLGKFTFYVEKSEIQTFHLQVCLPLGVRVLRELDSEGRIGRKAALQSTDLGMTHFSLQNDPPAAFPKVKIQILSNWGHPRFTCLYRVRAHGLQTSEGEGDSATQGPH